MVTGIESFKEWFKGNESQYAIIGGTACDILMTEEGLDFRATKDIDLVLIIEAVDVAFGRKFWDYVKQAGYEHCNKSSGVPQFYRFSHPTSNRYPAMIELFTRKLDAIQLPDDAVLTPLPMDEDISSLSAILIHATGSGNLDCRVNQFSQSKNIIFMLLNVFTINVFSGFFAIRQIHPCFRLEWNQICSIQNRHSINSHFPLLQELIVIIIQKDCRSLLIE